MYAYMYVLSVRSRGQPPIVYATGCNTLLKFALTPKIAKNTKTHFLNFKVDQGHQCCYLLKA